MASVVSLLVIAVVSLVVARVATAALTVTGMPRELARFQARSALTGVGFTTGESESVVTHPVRRRIVMGLMLLSNLQIATVLATVLSGVVSLGGTFDALERGLVLLVGLGALLLIGRDERVDRALSQVIERSLRRFTDLDVRDYASLLRLSGDYEVIELLVEPGDWLEGRTLAELDLPHEGVLVLGIIGADGSYIGAPRGAAVVHAGDALALYGRDAVIAEIDRRRAGREGEAAHDRAVAAARRQQEGTD